VRRPAALAWDPPLEYYLVDNRIRTVARAASAAFIPPRPGSLQVRLWGQIPRRDRGEDLLLAMEDPALYAAQALRRALEERGFPSRGAAALHAYPNELRTHSGGRAACRRGGCRTGAAGLGAVDRRPANHRQGEPEPARRAGAAGGGRARRNLAA